MRHFQENDIVQALRSPVSGAQRISALEYCVRYRVVEVYVDAAGNTVLGIRPVDLDDCEFSAPETKAMGTLAIGNPGLYLEKVEAKEKEKKAKGPSWIRDLREARATQERHVEALREGIRGLAGYLCSSKFEADPTVQVRDVLLRLQEIEAAGLATEYPD